LQLQTFGVVKAVDSDPVPVQTVIKLVPYIPKYLSNSYWSVSTPDKKKPYNINSWYWIFYAWLNLWV